MNDKKYFGVMLDCSRNAVMKPEQVMRFADIISSFGYNSIQLYTEDTYEIDGEPYFGYLRGRYTKEEIKAIDEHCMEKGVELIPCIQTLAHLNQIFRWSDYASIRDTDDILLAGEEKTYELIDKMFFTLAESFTSRKVNIGMDEAHMLGRGAYLDKNGLVNRFDILKKHLERVLSIAEKYGFECMMWSDMFMRLASGGDYYTFDKPVTSEAKACVPKNVNLVYWDYYHTEKRVYDGMFSVHKQLAGDKVWFAGGAWTWVGFAPRNGFTIKTMAPAMKSAAKNGIRNVFVTMWGDNGKECSFYSVLPSLYAIRKMYDGETDESSIKNGFKEIVGIDFDAMCLLDLPSDADGGKNTNNNPCRYLLYSDPLLGVMDSTVSKNTANEFKKAAKKLSPYCGDGEFAYLFETEKLLCETLALKCDLGGFLREAYKSENVEALKNGIKKIKKTEKKLKEFYYSFKNLWQKENKPHGFDVQELRIGGLMLRLSSARERIEDYLAGKISSVPELEEIILDPFCRKGEEGKPVCMQTYSFGSTVNSL